MYTYVKDGDKSLASFSIEHDKKFKIPFIKEAAGRQRQQAEPFASPRARQPDERQRHYAARRKLKTDFLKAPVFYQIHQSLSAGRYPRLGHQHPE